LRVAGAADAEAVPGGDQLHQVAPVGESSWGRDEAVDAVRGITSQGENVVDPRVAKPVENALQLLDGRVDAGQVRDRLDVQLATDAGHEVDGPCSHRSPRAVRDRHEGRL